MPSNASSGFEVQEKYGSDRLHLMVRDASSLFAYWEISDRRRWLTARHLECDWSEAPKALRVYNVTSIQFNGHNAHSFFDISDISAASDWFIHGVSAGTTYIVDYGVFTSNRQQFIPLLRSNSAATPRSQEAPWGAPIVSVFPEVMERKRPMERIAPKHYENFAPYGYRQTL
jgi:uncharacterized protein